MNSSTKNQTAACVYILHMLLQRLESERPGMLKDIAAGIAADQAAAGATESGKRMDGVFTEALRMVNLAQVQLRQ
ncbi:hypothetical protein [Cupriavidus plantarum]|uniref:Uncharacterized protein n=1 Tax=Cupriavidus plantarum TaxID=942865 RepID=A0A316F0I0_9BURK|nr:hypothetical protein [Cupriavidus plantarum]PWK37792.1 hypothetical protein C7419_1011678 [Cupriavidus plantarum]